jgi:hypothetical protein
VSQRHLIDYALNTIPGFFRRIRKGAVALLCLMVLLAAGFGYTLYAYPQLNIGPAQPIPFSHRIHAGVKRINCRFCHPFVERSASAGIPEVGKCLFCHEYIINTHPEIQKIQKYYNANEPIPWTRVFYLPDHVMFRHSPHIRAGLDCTECHGEVATADRLPAVEFEMGFCIRCHRKNDANMGCWLACHN